MSAIRHQTRPRRRPDRCTECGSPLTTPQERQTMECDMCKEQLDRWDAGDHAYDQAHEQLTDGDIPW